MRPRGAVVKNNMAPDSCVGMPCTRSIITCRTAEKKNTMSTLVYRRSKEPAGKPRRFQVMKPLTEVRGRCSSWCQNFLISSIHCYEKAAPAILLDILTPRTHGLYRRPAPFQTMEDNSQESQVPVPRGLSRTHGGENQ